jgi:hypothetical protein
MLFAKMCGRFLLVPLLMQLLPLPAVSAMAADTYNRLTPEEEAAGWQLLFDGESLEHWRTYQKPAPNLEWQAVDGELRLTRRGGGDLISRATWSNFELKLEWKISEGGNSGIFFLADETNQRIYFKAPEIQILDDARHSDNKVDTHRSGSLYDLIAAPQESQIPAGEWNTVVVRHLNGHLQAWQNDVQTVDIQIGGERWNSLVAGSKFAEWEGFGTLSSGHFGLQDHGDVVSFRNLKVRTLTEAP